MPSGRRTAYKNPMGMSPYKMVYGKACHLPLELENKAFWVVRELNADPKLAGEKRLMNLTSCNALDLRSCTVIIHAGYMIDRIKVTILQDRDREDPNAKVIQS